MRTLKKMPRIYKSLSGKIKDVVEDLWLKRGMVALPLLHSVMWLNSSALTVPFVVHETAGHFQILPVTGLRKMAVLMVHLVVVLRSIFLALLALHPQMKWFHNGMFTADICLNSFASLLASTCSCAMLKMQYDCKDIGSLYNGAMNASTKFSRKFGL